MEHAFAELPLALFTTLAPLAAGALLPLVLAFFTVTLSDEQAKRIDKLSWIPAAVLIVAFIAAFFHLTQPFAAVGVFKGIGMSPMSNEIVLGMVFFVFAIVYCILGLTGKLTNGSRKILAAVTAVIGFVFALFVGFAYMIETIASWNTMFVPVQVIGFYLLGGGLLGITMLAAAGVLKDARATSYKMLMAVVVVLGLLLAAGGLMAQANMVGGLMTVVVDGSLLAAEVMPFVICAIVLMVLSAAGACFALFKSDAVAIPAVSLIVVIAAIFVARLVFYAVQVSVGL